MYICIFRLNRSIRTCHGLSGTPESIIGSRFGILCSMHLRRFATVSSSCLLNPGHQTESLTRHLHFTIPWCPFWFLSRISSLILEGIISLEPLRRSPRTMTISPLELQYGLSLLHTRTSFCCTAICSRRLSEVGS